MSNIVAIAHAKAVRNRLWNPAGARQSTELDVLSAEKHQARQQAIVEWQHAKLDAETSIAIDNATRTSRAAGRLLSILRDRERAKAIAKKLEEEDYKPPSLFRILDVVTRYYRVRRIDVLSARRTAEIVLPRQITMYLARELTLHSMPAISRFLGGRDHTTVIHGYRKIRHMVDNHVYAAADIDNIKWELGIR